MPLDHPLPPELSRWFEEFLAAVPRSRGAIAEDEKGGFALRIMSACRTAGFGGSPSVLAFLSERTGVPVRFFRAAGGFLDHVAENAELPVRVCRGLHCRMNDGEARANRLVEALDVAARMQEVHCLDRCGNGPNLRCGRQVYQAGTGDVFDDDRSWRRPGVRLAGGGPPVRD